MQQQREHRVQVVPLEHRRVAVGACTRGAEADLVRVACSGVVEVMHQRSEQGREQLHESAASAGSEVATWWRGFTVPSQLARTVLVTSATQLLAPKLARLPLAVAGGAFVRLLRRREAPPPVIVVRPPMATTRDRSRTLTDALREGVFAVLDRPLHTERLLEVLRRATERSVPPTEKTGHKRPQGGHRRFDP